MAAQAYLGGSQQALQPAWPDRAQSDHGLTQAAKQLARTTEVLRLLRWFSENLREFDNHRRRFEELCEQKKGIVQISRILTEESRSLRTASQAAQAARGMKNLQ